MREGRNWSVGAYWGPSGQSAGATLGGHSCVACSRFVVADDRALRLPCLGERCTLYARCALDRVERARVGNPFRCPTVAYGVCHSRDLVLTNIARADPVGLEIGFGILRSPSERCFGKPAHSLFSWAAVSVAIRKLFCSTAAPCSPFFCPSSNATGRVLGPFSTPTTIHQSASPPACPHHLHKW